MDKIKRFLKSLNIDESQKQVFSITGKMASGKNYICSQFEKYGWKSIDADKLVHKAIELSKEQIYSAFKNEAEKQNINILNDDNSINRRELGRLLFSNPSLLSKQESIVYPLVIEMTENFIKENDKVLINATVLYKTPVLMQKCSRIIFVRSSFLKRFIRTKKRDHLPAKQILSRFNSQKDLYKNYKTTNIPISIIKN